MTHPTNPDAVRVKRDGPRGWHWVYPFDPAVHVLFDNALDHDGDGTSGGSVKGYHSTAAKGARRKKAAG